MMSKKAQQEIIVTVLLVLIALAAVAAVATFVINNVKKSTAGADDKMACSKVELDITNINALTKTVTITRRGSNVSISSTQVYVNGENKNSTESIEPGASASVNVTALETGNIVTVAPVLSNGYVCPVAASETVA